MNVHLVDKVLRLFESVHELELGLDCYSVSSTLECMDGRLNLEFVRVLSNHFEPVVHDSFSDFQVCHLDDTFDVVSEWKNEGLSKIHAITGDEGVHCVSEICPYLEIVRQQAKPCQMAEKVSEVGVVRAVKVRWTQSGWQFIRGEPF